MDQIAVEEAIPALQSALGPEKVLTEDFLRAAYTRDLTLYNYRYSIPSIVVLPESTQDVQEIVRVANCYKIPVVPIGAETTAWAAVESNGGMIIDTSKMNKIIDIDELHMTFTVEAGANIWDTNKELKKRGFLYPTFPLCYGPITFGAEVSKDTGGEVGSMYGHIAKRVIALEVVLGNGELLVTGSSRVLKDTPLFQQSGLPDLTQLFVAAEGAYGVITKVTMQMQLLPVARGGADIKFPGTMEGFKAACDCVAELRTRKGTIANAHLIDAYSSWMVERYFTGTGDIHDKSQEEAALERCGHTVLLEIDSFNSEKECEQKKEAALEVAKKYGGVYTGTQSIDAFRRAGEGDHTLTEIVYCGGYAGNMVVTDTPYDRMPQLYEGFLKNLDELDLPRAWSSNIIALGDDSIIPFYYPWCPRIEKRTEQEWNETMEKWKILAEKTYALAMETGSMPYRVGRKWRPYVLDKLEPSYLKYIQAVKNLFDPNNIMNPGVSVFEEVNE